MASLVSWDGNEKALVREVTKSCLQVHLSIYPNAPNHQVLGFVNSERETLCVCIKPFINKPVVEDREIGGSEWVVVVGVGGGGTVTGCTSSPLCFRSLHFNNFNPNVKFSFCNMADSQWNSFILTPNISILNIARGFHKYFSGGSASPSYF